MLDLQKASVLKRFSAWLLDFILAVILITGMAWLLTTVTGYENHINTLGAIYDKYEEQYDIKLNISLDEYEKLTEEELQRYTDAANAINSDEEALVEYNLIINLSLVVATLSVLLSYAVLEFIVPKLFGNGQTVGKKIFGIGVMRVDGVKISTLSLFVRTFLGKYTIETMIPLLIIIFMMVDGVSIVSLAVLALIAILEIAVLCSTKTNSLIHDLMSQTVTVDLSSQMIFNDENELLEYKKKLHAERVEDSDY